MLIFGELTIIGFAKDYIFALIVHSILALSSARGTPDGPEPSGDSQPQCFPHTFRRPAIHPVDQILLARIIFLILW
jgi:hypothetical protein